MSSAIKVLIVDDEPQIQRFLRPSLTAGGFQVESAQNAAEALRAFETKECDMIILDLGLPGLDGLSVLRRWRAEELKTPVIILSARGTWA